MGFFFDRGSDLQPVLSRERGKVLRPSCHRSPEPPRCAFVRVQALPWRCCSLGGDLDEEAGLADVAEICGEEKSGEEAPNGIEKKGVLDISPRDGLPGKDGAHAFEDRGAWKGHGGGLKPRWKDGDGVEDGGEGLDEEGNGPSEALGGLAVAHDEGGGNHAEGPAEEDEISQERQEAESEAGKVEGVCQPGDNGEDDEGDDDAQDADDAGASHALAHLDPVPGNTCSARFGVIAPEGLTAAGAVLVAETEHSRAQVDEVQIRRGSCLPQYGGPSVDSPCWCHGARRRRRVDDRTSLRVDE